LVEKASIVSFTVTRKGRQKPRGGLEKVGVEAELQAGQEDTPRVVTESMD